MKIPELPEDEELRLAELRALKISSIQEHAFDRITSLAATLFQVPIALITLIEEYDQWLKSNHGGENFAPVSSRELSFCGHTILQDGPLVVEDTTLDDRFSGNPAVTEESHIRFYAGAPITTPNGYKIGSMCLIDRKPRTLTPEQSQVLVDLAGMVMTEIELRSIRRATKSQFATLEAALDIIPTGVVLLDENFQYKYVNRSILNMFGFKTAEEVLNWTPAAVAKYAEIQADNPVPPETWRTISDTGFVVVLRGARPRVVRRTLHRLQISDTPYMSLWSDITSETEEIARKEREAQTDHLTGLANRQAGHVRMAQLLDKGPVAAIMFDIDHFKLVNDTYGHPIGDEVLRLVSGAARAVAREDDLVCRWGGEEFMVFLREPLETACIFAERLRIAIESVETPVGKVTVSIGVAVGESQDILHTVDEKLYEAKAAGRNRVCC